MQYGCIGEKLGHSFSKEIHAALADYTYELCEMPYDALEGFFEKKTAPTKVGDTVLIWKNVF